MSSTTTSMHLPPYSAHSSQRDNQSLSSSSSSSCSVHSDVHPAAEPAVARLLVAIRQLLESLTQWSQRKMDEDQVSDVYVCLGDRINAVVVAFDIDMKDLLSLPRGLRDVLETCLAEEATPGNLNAYLPKVCRIITNLLRGLRGKQSIGANGYAHPGSVPPQTKQSQNMYQSNGDVLSHEPSETLVAHSTLSTSLNSFRRKLNKLVKKLRRTSPIQSAPIPVPVKLHSLVDRPISSPSKSSTAVLIEETPVTPSDSRHPTPPTEILAPAAVSYVRERPASKCFSTSEIR
ncbi:hypothetical protein M405DRAFT_27007, partial [Rhizopogon salebrosus TDB-379]